MADNMTILKENTLFWSRLGFYPDPVIGDGKSPEVFFDIEKQKDYHKQMVNAGIKLHTSILFSGWVGVEKIDYTLTDKTLDAIMSVSDDIYYVPRIKLNVPIEWCREYPQEVFVYENGPVETDEIKELVGTEFHDNCGIMKNTATGKAEKVHKNQNSGDIGMQSFASKKWLEDAGKVLKELIQHIENGPYADRIAGYHLAYGLCGETVLWGRPTKQVGDYSCCAKKAFYEWGINKYGSPECLSEKWNQVGVTAENIIIPTKEQRQGITEEFDEFFRRNEEDIICIDYDEFMSDINVDAMEYFSKIVKDCTDNKPVGFFYGYILGVYNPAYTGHLGIERVLNSRYIDFITAPKAYYKKVVGESGGSFIPIQSVNRKKIWLDELDNQTHLINQDYSLCRDFNDSRSVMWREACKNASYGSNFWWMDLYGGAFDSNELLNEVAKIEKFKKKVCKDKASSKSEVLIVVDEQTFYHTRKSFELQDMHWEILRQIGKSGTLVDIYRLSDLKDLELSNYKFVVFLMPYSMDSVTYIDILNSLNKEAVIFWNYAPGASHGFETMTKLCGFKFELSNLKAIDGFTLENGECSDNGEKMDSFEFFVNDETQVANLKSQGCEDYGHIPMLEIVNSEDVKVLAKYKNGGIAGAETNYKGHKNICFTMASIRAEHWTKFFEAAGVFMYAPSNIVVYGNEKFISVFNNDAMSFQLKLPQKSNLICINTMEKYINQDCILLDMPKHSANIFVFDNDGEI